MTSSELEKARVCLEDMEVLERFAVETLETRASGAKAKMERDLILANVVREMSAAAKTILSPSAEFEEEKRAMRGEAAFGAFYGQLKETREYYAAAAAKVPQSHLSSSSSSAAVERARRRVEDVEFSGEEMWGKYLDMSALHMEFCNLGLPLEYTAYLRMLLNRKFSTHAEALEKKRSSAYAAYAARLEAYLVGFWARARPLDVTPGGFEKGDEGDEKASPPPPERVVVDLSSFSSAKDLEALGLDRLKEGLLALDLKCGGSLEQRAERLFSVKGLDPAAIDPSLRRKKKKASDDDSSLRVREKRIEKFLELLEPVVEATLRRAERKMTRTKEELDRELDDERFGTLLGAPVDEEKDDDDEDDDDLAAIYNPKNLPLGWDGRPIPYWLYKLHGLDVSYSCEICGNHTYYGRRAFEQHFNEWRHSHGMRCLRIPNTKHFHGVTKMDDAVALWELLQEKTDADRFRPDRDEEYEDSDGNVLNRATYEDLARQGLL